MCITMAAVGLAASLAGTAMSVMGSIQQGKAAAAQGEYQARVSENNAKIAEWQAKDAEARGAEEERQHRVKVNQFLGSQRAGIAGSGFDIGDETSMSLLGDSAAAGELDALTIRSNAAREAWGYRVQGSNATADAQISRLRGQNARTASYYQAGGDLLGGAARFADTYTSYKAKGIKLA